MKVTDEMVEAALTAWKETNVMFGDLHALMRAALDAALSHAAGQEAEKEGDRLNFRRQMADAEHYQREFAATTRRIIDEQNAAPAQEPINPAEIDRKLVGGEAVAWRTIKPCGLRRYMTQAQYDANPSVQKWYEPFKCADCRAPAQPPASAEVVPPHDAEEYNNILFTSDERVAAIRRQAEATGWNKCRAWVIAAISASSGRKGDAT